MRRVCTIWSGLLLCLCLCPAALAEEASQQAISLNSLMEGGRHNHPSLAKQPLLAASLSLQRERINRTYWPQLSVGGQVTWQSEVTQIDIPLPGISIPAPAKDQYRATLDLRQNLWDGGAASEQERIAEAHTRVEREKVNLEWYQVQDQILQLYFAGIVQQELRTQAEELDRHLATIVEEAKVSLTSGVATRRDVLLVSARQLEARQAIVDATARLASIRQSLHELTGVELQEARLVLPVGGCPSASSQPAGVDTVRRPELSLLTAQGQVLDAQQQLQRAAERPKVGAFATAGYGRPGFNPLDSDFRFYFIGGVQLTVPLTHLYAGTPSIDREQLATERALLERQRDVVIDQVKVQLDARGSELHRLEQAIHIDAELLEARALARKQTELQLELGTASMTDLVNDLTQEDHVRTQGAVHRAQRSLACHELALIRGEL